MLLFSVQPMIGKMVLPIFGGTPAVWNTCLVFFQGTLLCGYLLAHGVGRAGWIGACVVSLGLYLLGLRGLLATLGYLVQPIVLERRRRSSSFRRRAVPALVSARSFVAFGHTATGLVSATAPLVQSLVCSDRSSPGRLIHISSMPRAMRAVCWRSWPIHS